MYIAEEVNGLMFFDTETVPKYRTLNELEEKEPQLYHSWETKVVKYHEGYGQLHPQEMWLKFAGLHIEFCKIVCISMGKISFTEDNSKLTTTLKDPKYTMVSFCGHDEIELLKKSWALFNRNKNLAGFNIIDFDVPLLARKFLYNGIKLPAALSIRGKKPWELNMVDMMKDLQFGSTKKVSLERVTLSMGLGTSKDGAVKGESLGKSYWEGADLKDIQDYCEADVRLNMEAVFKMMWVNLENPTETVKDLI